MIRRKNKMNLAYKLALLLTSGIANKGNSGMRRFVARKKW